METRSGKQPPWKATNVSNSAYSILDLRAHPANQTLLRETAQRFPSLEVLDQEAITPILFDHPVTSSPSKADKQIENRVFPCEMGPSFVTGVDGTIVSNFLVRYVIVAGLVSFYALIQYLGFSMHLTHSVVPSLMPIIPPPHSLTL